MNDTTNFRFQSISKLDLFDLKWHHETCTPNGTCTFKFLWLSILEFQVHRYTYCSTEYEHPWGRSQI